MGMLSDQPEGDLQEEQMPVDPAAQNMPMDDQQLGGEEETAGDIPIDVQGVDSGKIDELYKLGIDFLYNERFPDMVDMFEKGGVEGFPRSMATAINTTLQGIEGQLGPDPIVAAAVGAKLFTQLLGDIVGGGAVPKLEEKVIGDAFQKTLEMYASSHKDTVSDQDMSALSENLASRGAPNGNA